jgi:hypothetical protein
MRKHGSQPASPSNRPTPGPLILAAGTALALIAAPVTLSPNSLALTWQVAAAKGDGGGQGGGGNGGGGGNSGSHGNGHGNGHDGAKDPGHGRPDDVGGGWAYGRDRQDERIEQARQRYDAALGHADAAGHGLKGDDQRVAHRFSADETHQLIEHSWRARQVADAGFKNHGQRVRTMIELAKRLGYDAKVGALQANFGTPYENGIARIEADLEVARADLAAGDEAAASRVAALEAQLDAAVAAAKPGNGANHDWARADLDVNGDGVVDRHDLEALDAPPADQDPSATASS